ncbi:MAG TPA: hypothetical protein VH253_07780 [Phycisphaerae bacterium]|nr:hypothetical protein [Phycisphaerae bacterium]
MDESKHEEPPPDSKDLAGWKRAIDEGRLGGIRPEAIVAAIQDLGPCTAKFVLNALAKHLNNVMLSKLRSLVSASYPNKGVSAT